MGIEIPVGDVELAMTEVCDEYIMPRFRHLADTEIFEKGPGDFATIADRESEAALALRLLEIDPAAVVVGEEAVASDPQILDLARGTGRVWIIDPIDGTGSFVRGRPRFAVMVALVEGGRTIGGWIWQPIGSSMYTATSVTDAQLNARPIDRAPVNSESRGPFEQLSGDVRTTYFGDEARSAVERTVGKLPSVRLNRGGACGYVYPDLACGRLDYAVFSRQYPWDHAAGALILEQAGGAVRDLDGRAYDPTSTSFGLLATGRAADWEAIKAHVFDSQR